MTREEFEPVKAAGVQKWTKGAEQTEETYLAWWGYSGKVPCAFCGAFSCRYGAGWDDYEEYPQCPIQITRPTRDNVCAREWNVLYRLWEHGTFTFARFHKYAVALRDRIANLTYEDVKQ